MSAAGPADDAERSAFKRAAVERVENGMVGLGPGSTAFAIEARGKVR
jgi:L-aminopeptidase/D-esterase-like protein